MKPIKLLSALAAMVVVPQAFAQDWILLWGQANGTSIVPLGPMVSITLALSLGVIAVHFLRKGSGTLAGALVAAALGMGILGYSMDRAAAVAALNTKTINGASGRAEIECNGTRPWTIINVDADPLTFDSVTSSGNFAPVNGVLPNCAKGLQLLGSGGNGSSCVVSCMPVSQP